MSLSLEKEARGVCPVALGKLVTIISSETPCTDLWHSRIYNSKPDDCEYSILLHGLTTLRQRTEWVAMRGHTKAGVKGPPRAEIPDSFPIKALAKLVRDSIPPR